MPNNPITVPLPQDLPTNWTYGQTIGAAGTDVGLTQQHGYNYLMQQVNAAQQAAQEIGAAFEGLTADDVGAFPATEDPSNPGCYYLMNNGGQEWINPPMKLGTEYRTIERWNGQPVYCIAWPGGAFPDSSTKTVYVNTGTAGAVTAIDSYVVLGNGTMANGMMGDPTPQNLNDNYIGAFLQNNSNEGIFSVILGSNRTVSTDCTIYIKYTRGRDFETN